MTDSQFETLRQELRAMRGDFDQRLRAIETRLTKLEVHIEAKPDKASVFQTSMAVGVSLIATVCVTLLVLSTFLVSA